MGTALGVALAGALFTAAAAWASGPTADGAAAHGLTVALVALGSIALVTGLALVLEPEPIDRRRQDAASPTTEVQS